MWLIDVKTRELVRFVDSRKVAGEYAILSHTWDEDELTFADGQDLASQSASYPIPRHKKGYLKVDFTCRQAEVDNLRYAWVDTCCINQDSSAELSEAIDSMFRWYQNAKICYVYLSDPPDNMIRTPQFHHLTIGPRIRVEAEDDFARCRWFTRGWTLQELLAPVDVRFFTKDWNSIGTKRSLQNTLQRITGITIDAIASPDNIWSCSVSERMSWAANRLTTREEDSAYCLLGIFDVNIPLLYGEGGKAFVRLQEEILRTSLDHSLLCWRTSQPRNRNELLAPDASCFKDIVRMSSTSDVYDYDGHQLMSKGLSITLPTRPCGVDILERYAALNCSAPTGAEGGYAVLLLRRISREYHKNQIPTRATTYEVIREDKETVQPQSLWHDSDFEWLDEVSIDTIVIVPHRVSTTLRFDYPEDRLEITEAYPDHCFIRRSAEFHFIPGRNILDNNPQESCIKLYDKVSRQSRYLCTNRRTKPEWDQLSLYFRDEFPSPELSSTIASWSLNKGATTFWARTWTDKEIPPGMYVVQIWDGSEAIPDREEHESTSDPLESELGKPTSSHLSRRNSIGRADVEPMDTETESISSFDHAAESA